MSSEKEIIMAINNIYNKVGWLNKMQLLEKSNEYDYDTYTASEIFCIEYIGNHKDANGKRLADACYITRSGLSKLMKKMSKKGLVIPYQKPNNKKEVCYKLSVEGEKIYSLHEEMTRKFLMRDKVVFEKMSPEKISTVMEFFEQYDEHLEKELKNVR